MHVYLDNAATTPVATEVAEAMMEVLTNQFGNPSSSHFYGRQVKALLETSRRNVAKHINCHPSEVIFTSGGTEADNMAFHIAINELGVKKIVTTNLEHHAVGHTAHAFQVKQNIELCLLPTDSKGNINLDDLDKCLKDGVPTLVSLMHANNEIATLLPIKRVAEICKKHGAYFHSDTVQTMGHYTFDLAELDIDFITCAAHKFHGPKGIGFLYANRKNKIASFIYGGSQERGLRGGTENTAGIVGLSKALDLAYTDLQEHHVHVQGLKYRMMEKVKEILPTADFHGETDPEKSLYTVINICLPPTSKSGILLFTLDLKGIACSGGSACSSGANKGSHVLEGIGADPMRPNVRFSFSRLTTEAEVDFAVKALAEVYAPVLV